MAGALSTELRELTTIVILSYQITNPTTLLQVLSRESTFLLLIFSPLFIAGGTRPLPVMAQSGHRRLPRRTRSQRSQTMPIFDVASDRISRLFTSSSSPEPSVCYDMLH